MLMFYYRLNEATLKKICHQPRKIRQRFSSTNRQCPNNATSDHSVQKPPATDEEAARITQVSGPGECPVVSYTP